MGVQGQYLDKHNRRYVNYNPNEFNGPFTWRLSMMPTFIEDPDDITTIHTLLPIDSNTNLDGSMNLYFNIWDLEDVYDTARKASGKFAAQSLLNLPGLGKRSMFGLKSITGVLPVDTLQRGTDVAIFFNIDALPHLETKSKGYFTVKANDYNSKSIDKLSADKPLFTTDGGTDDVIVTFDISSLDPA